MIGDIDQNAFAYFDKVIGNSESLYKRIPIYEDKLMGLRKDYSHSDTIKDELSGQLVNKSPYSKKNIKNKSTKKENEIGFCIRSGEKIPFNPESPFSDKAYKSWSKYRDKDYKEQYCHYSGEKSNGKTSFAKPILKKNWNKAKNKI